MLAAVIALIVCSFLVLDASTAARDPHIAQALIIALLLAFLFFGNLLAVLICLIFFCLTQVLS